MAGGGNKQTSVLMARAAVRPNNSLIPLRLVNSSLAPVTVYKGAKIATAELIHDNNICVVMSPSKESNVVNKIDLAHPLPEDLSQSEREKFLALLSNYVDILATNSNDLGQTDVLNHRIDTGNAVPIRQSAWRVPLPHRGKVRELLDGMLDKKLISPSHSPWASPIVLVTKKDGTTRFCVDYRKVNEVTRKDAYPIPRVDDTLDTLAGSLWFSTLDLKSGYWQVRVVEEHREKTAFCTQEGLYEFNVMPFGLCNAPSYLPTVDEFGASRTAVDQLLGVY